MSDTPGPLADLAHHARETHVVVVGAGIAGLVAAYECAKVGVRVTLLESRSAVGGAIRDGDVDGARIPVGALGYATRGDAVRAVAEELGIEGSRADVVRPTTWISGIPGGAAPLPRGTLLGIPANPWDPSVRRIVGWAGVWRAYVDRLRPPLTIGAERNLDRLVRGRMGARIVERLVAPLSAGRHGLLPSQVDVGVAAPGLASALTRTGSLGGAVGELTDSPATGPSYETFDGGPGVLVDALRARLADLGATLRTDARVSALVSDGGVDRARWTIVQDDVDAEGDAADEPLHADAVIVATHEDEARRLLAPHVTVLGDERSERVVDVVHLVVAASSLAASDRGDEICAVPGTSPASTVEVLTARHPWLAERLGPDRGLVRVVFHGGVDRSSAVDTAVAAASDLLGVALAPDLIGARTDRFDAAPPASAFGREDASRAARAAVALVPGLAVVGAWISGSGLAQVVPDAAGEAERVRRRALFGEAAPE